MRTSQDHFPSNSLSYEVKFLIVLGILNFLGLMMVYSSSYIFAKDHFGSPLYYTMRQLIYLSLGIFLAFFLWKTKFEFWLKYSLSCHFFFTVMLLMTFIPGLGISAKGASRWIYLGWVSLQPGEFVKYTTLLSSFYYFENFYSFPVKERCFWGFTIIAPLFLFLLQPDFGTFSICFLFMCVACFMSSFPRRIFYTSMAVGLLLGLILMFLKPYRVVRLLSFLDPWKNPKTSGFQIIQSYLAFATGGIWGTGLGNSHGKLFYLPEAHNDFIFSVLGEELGLIGVVSVVFLFLFLAFYGIRYALSLKKRVHSLASAILVIGIVFQAILNMAVVLGLLPTKGLNLPFLSYGGSSLMANFMAVGWILSAGRGKDLDILSQHKDDNDQLEVGNSQ